MNIVKSFIKKNNIKITDIKNIYDLINNIDESLLESLDETILEKYYKLALEISDNIQDSSQLHNQNDNQNDIRNNIENISNYIISDAIMEYLNSPKMLKFSINPKFVTKKAYIYLDSRHRTRLDDLSLFKWNINIKDIYNENDAIVTNKVRNIISMELMPFVIPSCWFLLSNSNRLYVSILEFLQKSYVQYSGRFHFEYYLEYKSRNFAEETGYRINYDTISNPVSYPTVFSQITSYILTSDIRIKANEIGNSRNIFYFDNPINELNTITMEFSNGLEKLKLDADGLDEINNSYTNTISKYNSRFANNIIVQNHLVKCQVSATQIATILSVFINYSFSTPIINSSIPIRDTSIIIFLDFTTDYPDHPEHKKVIDIINRPEGWKILSSNNYIDFNIYYALNNIPTGYNPLSENATKYFNCILTTKELNMRLELNYLDLE